MCLLALNLSSSFIKLNNDQFHLPYTSKSWTIDQGYEDITYALLYAHELLDVMHLYISKAWPQKEIMSGYPLLNLKIFAKGNVGSRSPNMTLSFYVWASRTNCPSEDTTLLSCNITTWSRFTWFFCWINRGPAIQGASDLILFMPSHIGNCD